MSKFTDNMMRAMRFCRSRVGSVLLLTLCCLICVFSFSSYISSDSTLSFDDGYYFGEDTAARQSIVESDNAYAGSEEIVVRVDTSETAVEAAPTNSIYNITVIDAGVSTEYISGNATVAQFLLNNAIIVNDSDLVSVALTENVYDCMIIYIDRVTYEDIAVNEIITSKTVKIETDELYVGETQIVSAGSDGIKTIVTRTTYINGVYSSSEVISEEITTPVINRVVNVGTRTEAADKADENTFVDAAGRTVAYTRVINGKGSAYTAPVGTTGTTGRQLSVGIVAVDPDVIPYGTRLYITSADGKYVYGYALAADTNDVVESGAAVVGLFYDTDSQCKVFGDRNVIIYVLES